MTPPLPEALAALLPTDTAACWVQLASLLPPEAYLAGGTAITAYDAEPGRQTMSAVLRETKLQILEASTQVIVEPLTQVGSLPVAALGDLLATKLKVIADRGELRDYYDIKAIEELGHRRIEEGLALMVHRYRPRAPEEMMQRSLRALGYLDDVPADPIVPDGHQALAAYFAARVPEIVRNLSRW
ncbi:MAG: nucleotidyl transferase AbiEii/AbiGii toxin family protein [Mycobacteriales bacterium]